MAKVLNHGTVSSFHEGHVERYKETVKLEDAIIEAARDGEDINLLIAFARGDFADGLKEGYSTLMARVLYIASLNEHDSVIKAVFGVNPSSIDCYGKDTFGYEHVSSIHAELSGESSDASSGAGGDSPL